MRTAIKYYDRQTVKFPQYHVSELRVTIHISYLYELLLIVGLYPRRIVYMS